MNIVIRRFCTERVILYRGINKKHKYFKDALEGTVKPTQLIQHEKEGKIFEDYSKRTLDELFDLAEDHHHAANTSLGSPFTSWTRNIEIAKHFAGDSGVILQGELGHQISHCFPSPNDWGEDEVLVYGKVTNATLIPTIICSKG